MADILVIDDEPPNVQWLLDFLESEGHSVTLATDVNEGVSLIDEKDFRFLIVDLNVPVFAPLAASVADKGELYIQYPGLYAAWSARNKGYRDRQVVVYTVHRDALVSAEAEKIRCTYIMKGRPRMLKDEITQILAYTPED